MMSSLKAVLDIGLQYIPGVGKALDAGLDMATTAAQLASYLYSAEDKPDEAFSWSLSPCGSTELVPDEIKKIFDILNPVTDGVSSFNTPKKLRKGSGKKGDDGNPHDQPTPRSTKRGSNGKPKCSIPTNKQDAKSARGKIQFVNSPATKMARLKRSTKSSSLPSSAAIPPTSLSKPLALQPLGRYYQSVIKANPKFATLTCVPEAASTTWRYVGVATDT